jgi:GcrA cell cycle regulator
MSLADHIALHNGNTHIREASPPPRSSSSQRLRAGTGISMAKKQAKQKTLANLEQNDCRWPIGDPKDPDFHFCGAQKLAGRPYCQAHWQMAFQPPRSRQAAPVPMPNLRRAA